MCIRDSKTTVIKVFDKDGKLISTKKDGPTEIARTMSINAGNDAGTASVSYTHLDVYKRQELILIAKEKKAACFFELDICLYLFQDFLSVSP